ncbi:hypothetical protein LTS08_004184 [Lithohypha guttulata]|nr:hypothetical protein LTS08_004184 [Lithohypha guttulata]
MSEKQSAKADKKDGEDLTTVLDKSQRADLTLLIANITESMRKLILDNFDAAAGLDQEMIQREQMTEDEKMMSADISGDVNKYEQQKKLKAQYEKELESPKMKNLKKNCLRAYDEWREQVIMRVGKAVNSEDEAKQQIDKSKSTEARPNAPTTVGKITEAPKKNGSLKFKDLFPPTKTPLTKLSMDRRTLVLHSVLLLLLSLEHYNAASRVLLLNLTSSLKLSLKTFEQDEYVTAKGLLENAKELSGNEETRKKAEENQATRQKKVRYATIAGAAALGIAGSFAAPLIAAGIGSVATGLGLGTTAAAGYLGSVASSSLLVGSLFGAYGGRMTGQMMDEFAREVEDFEFLPVHTDKRTSEDPDQGAQEASEHDHKLRVTICLSGWLREKEEVVKPWRVIGSGSEVFALKWELEALLNLGNAMDGMVSSAAWGYAQKELIGRTVFAELMGAMWPLGLLKVAQVVDNPFTHAKARAEKAGEILAEVLIKRAQGERPVTLIGYSLGARAIYVCLQTLAKHRAFNLVENAVLIGAPTPSDTSDWRVLRSAVSGRLVNVYSTNDYILGFMYRTSAIQYGVAGLQPVDGLPGVENVDVSEDVDGHTRYRFLIGGILKRIGFEDIDMEAVQEEQEALNKMIEEEKNNSLQAQRNRLMRQESYKKEDGKVDEDALARDEVSDLEKQPRAPNTKDAEKVAANLQRAVQNPSDLRAAASDTAKDVQDSTASMAQRVYQALPNIPYMGSSTATGGVAKADPGKVAEGATKETQSYTSKAAAYLPKNLPSMPSMPALPRYSKPKDTSSAPAKATKDAGETAKKATSTATDTVGTTVKNVGNVNENPATKQLKEAPGIKQALDKDPGVTEKLGEATGAVGTTVNNTTDKVTGATEKATDAAGEAGAKGVDAADAGVKKVTEAGKGIVPGLGDSDNKGNGSDKGKSDGKQQQSYTSYAASYLPSMPSWGGSKKEAQPSTAQRKPSAPKLEKRDSAKPSKLERKESEAKQSSSRPPPPKLGRKSSSNTATAKSPPPKLGPRKASEPGTKSPLQRVASGAKNVPGAGQLPNIGEQLPGTDTAKQAASAPQDAAKKGTDAAGQVASKGVDSAKQAASVPQGIAEKGTEAAGQVASKGQDAASAGTAVATDAASKGKDAVGAGASATTDAAGQAASKGKDAVSTGASATSGAVSGVFGSGKKMLGFGR